MHAPLTTATIRLSSRDRPEVPMSLAAGTGLGPYEIESPIGAGGMGEVYKARDTRLERPLAIKVFSGLMSRWTMPLACADSSASAS